MTRFADSLGALGVGLTRTSAEDATAAIAAAAEGTTVGSPLPFDGVSLPDEAIRKPTLDELERATTGITGATLGVADSGSVVVRPSAAMEGSVSLFPPRHVAVVAADRIVPSVGAALERLASAFADGANDAVFVTGTSSTADMGRLVEGVHGPAEMHVVVVE